MADWSLFLDLLTPQAQALLNKSRQAGAAGDWEQVEQVAQEAQELWHRGGDWFGCATVLVSLAQVCQEGGKPELARRYHRGARRLIDRQISPSQQISEALTTYAAALFNQITGYSTEARRLFRQTVAILERTASRCLLAGDEKLAWHCQRLAREIAEQGEQARAGGGMAGLFATLTWGWATGAPTTRRFLAELETLRYLTARQLRVGDRTFRAHSADGEEEEVLILKPGEDYFVLEAPRQASPALAAEEGDYLLLRRADGGLTETPQEAEAGECAPFARDETGRVRFTLPAEVEERYARLVGGEIEVVSVLKSARTE
jgi:hypothetical protein